MQYSTWTDLARGNGGNDPKDAFILCKIAAMRTRSAIMALFGLNSFCLLGRANDTLCNSMRPPGLPHGKDPQEHFLLDNNFQYRVGQIVPWSLLVVFVPRLSICWLWGPWHTQPVSSSPGSCALKETSSVVNRAQKCTRTDFDYAQICKCFPKGYFPMYRTKYLFSEKFSQPHVLPDSQKRIAGHWFLPAGHGRTDKAVSSIPRNS